jgi:hypothetical protein
MNEEKDEQGTVFTIDDFYDKIQKITISWNTTQTLRFINSRSTSENFHVITMLCLDIKNTCASFCAPIEGTSPIKTESRINAFKYFICNTSFACQSLLADDTANGHLVDIQPPFSPYLCLEILWSIGFEDILTESILHFPLDLSLEIIEILPRCVNLLDFQRASKFLSTLIVNTYKKFIIIRDVGSQSENIIENCKKLTGNLQELFLQFTNERSFNFLNYNKIRVIKIPFVNK